MRSHRSYPALECGWPILFLATSAAALAAAALPSESITSAAGVLATDGRADFLTPLVLLIARALLSCAGAALFIGGVLSWRFRKTVARTLNPLARNALNAPLVFVRNLRAAWSEFVETTSRAHLAALTALFLTAVALRIYYAWSIPLRNDEAHTIVHYALTPLSVGLRDYTYLNNHVFNSLLMHLSSIVFGRELWALRLPAVAAGILMCPALYFVTRMLYGKGPALLATAFLSGSSYMLEYGCIARGYSLMTLSFLLLFLTAQYILDHRKAFGVPLFAVIAALGFYSNPTMQYPFCIVFFWLFLKGFAQEGREKRRAILRDAILAASGAVVLTVLLYAPIIHYNDLASIANNRMMDVHRPAGIERWVEWKANLTDLVVLTHRAMPIVLALLLGVAFLTVLLTPRKVWAREKTIRWPAAVGIVGIVWLQGVAIPPKGWIWFVPLYFAMASAGIVYFVGLLTRREKARAEKVLIAGALVVCIWSGAATLSSGSVENSDRDLWIADPELVTRYLKSVLAPDDKIIVVSPSDKTLYYYSMLNEMPMEHFKPSADGYTAYVVVNELHHDFDTTIELYAETVCDLHLSERAQSPPKLLKRISSSAIYRLKLRPAK